MKTVLITGCSAGGIGEALARAFHKQGLKVIATARDPTKAKPLQDLGITVFALDVTSEASIAAAVKAVDNEVNGVVDILVNNAGVGKHNNFQ
jgi:1-acylglycerone phosphate reductase